MLILNFVTLVLIIVGSAILHILLVSIIRHSYYYVTQKQLFTDTKLTYRYNQLYQDTTLLQAHNHSRTPRHTHAHTSRVVAA